MEDFTQILQRLRSGIRKYQLQNNGEMPSHILMSYETVNLVESYAFEPTGCRAFEFAPLRYRGVPIIAMSGSFSKADFFIAIGKMEGI